MIAAPVGPIGILCIRRTLEAGARAGLACGMGAACADAFYGATAAFGLTAVTRLLLSARPVLAAVGGLFLVYLGVRTILDSGKPASSEAPPAPAPARGALQGFASTFGLTLTNPMTILSFAAIFAAAGLVGAGAGPVNASWMVLGVFLGSAAWWLTLVFLVGLMRERFGRPLQMWAGRISGVALLGFGLLALASPFFPTSQL